MDNSYSPDDFDAEQLIGQLRRLPLQDVPPGLTGTVMARIGAAGRRPGLLHRCLQRINLPVAVTIRPLPAFGLAALLCMAFLLGRLTVPSLPESVVSTARDTTVSSLLFEDAEAAYLVGRGLLAAEQRGEGLALLQRAAALDPGNPEYALWEGIAHWSNGNREQEKNSYQRGLQEAPDSLPLLINLGHHYLSDGRLHEALDAYRTVLTLAPREAIAWYNSGLIYRNLKLVAEEISAWKEFLRENRVGSQAFRAVERLNDYGDFSYRPYWIGSRRVILSPELLLADGVPAAEKRREVAMLADLLEKNSGLTLEVAIFAEGDRDRARNRGLAIKRLIMSVADASVAARIEVSWFDTPEIIKVSAAVEREIAESLLLFGKNSNNKANHTKEVSI